MWFIKRKKELGPIPAEPKWTGKVRERLALAADRLSRRTASYSKRKWLLVLGLFCLCFGLWSLAVIYHSLRKEPSKEVLVPLPVSISRLPIQEPKPATRIPGSDMEKIARFEQYFDSLPAAAQDSLLRHRPGLFDTVAQLKRLYVEQYGKDSSQTFNNPK